MSDELNEKLNKKTEAQNNLQPANDAHDGELSDDELGKVSGGTEPTAKRKKGEQQQEFLEIKLVDILISS